MSKAIVQAAAADELLAQAVVPHRSGAIPLLNELDPNDPKNGRRSAFLCANPDQNPNCLGKDYCPKAYFKRDTWGGKCQSCIAYGGHYRTLKKDRTLKNGTKVLITQEDAQGRVPIEFFRCKHRIMVPRDHAIQYSTQPGRRGPSRLGVICRTCYEDPLALAERLVELKLRELEVPKSFEDEVAEAIKTVWDGVKGLPLSHEKKLKLVTGIEIARVLHLGDVGTQSSADQLRIKLTRATNVRDRFPGEKQWFPAYVKSVVEGLK